MGVQPYSSSPDSSTPSQAPRTLQWGDPIAPSGVIPLSSLDVSRLCQTWPQLDELRRAARSNVSSRWLSARSAIVATTRVEFTAAIKAARSRRPGLSAQEDIGLAVLVLQGLARFEAVSGLLAGGLSHLASFAGWSPEQLLGATAALRLSVGVSALPMPATPPGAGPRDPSAEMCKFPHALVAFGSALACGWAWSLAMGLFSQLSDGWFSQDGCTFWTKQGRNSSLWSDGRVAGWLVSTVGSELHDQTVRFYHCGGQLGAVVGSMSLRIQHASPQSRGVIMRRRKDGSTFASRFLPPWLRLPRNESGDLVLSAFHVTSVVERRHEWRRIIGNVDGATWAVLCGQMAYPRSEWLLKTVWQKNHNSWEKDDVKQTMGPKMATYIMQGAIEVIPMHLEGEPPPGVANVNPVGAVDKKGKDKYRIIQDARLANLGVDDWGVRLFSITELIDMLDWCSIMYGDDISDGYHVAVCGGCTMDLVWGWGVTGIEDVWMDVDSEVPSLGRVRNQQFVWGWRLHVGCWPEDCLLSCDKAAGAFCLDGWLMRWAVAHFGQKCAGCPLNLLAMCLLRFLARKEVRRGAQEGPVQGVAWVDDFLFHKSVRRHPPCSGLEGGCPVCKDQLPRAEADQRYWVGLCPKLGIHLHPDKRQNCSQRAEYTGFVVDTLKGRLLMMAEKLEKLLTTVQEWMGARVIRARGLAKVRGKAVHYSACISFLRFYAVEVSYLLGSEQEEDEQGAYDWDREFVVTPKMVALGGEMLEVVRRFAPKGRELWPLVPTTLYGRFMAGKCSNFRLFALT